MAENKNQPFSTAYANGRLFKAGIMDLLGAPVDAIVNPANSGLSHGGGLAAVISDEAGPELDAQCEKIIDKIGRIHSHCACRQMPSTYRLKGSSTRSAPAWATAMNWKN